MVTDMAPSSGKGVRYGVFHRCGVTAMVLEVLLGVGGFDVDRDADVTMVNTDVDVHIDHSHFCTSVPTKPPLS